MAAICDRKVISQTVCPVEREQHFPFRNSGADYADSGYANSHNVPMTLRSPRCALPPYYHNGIESESGFRALTTLFAHFDEAAPSSRRDSELTKESLAALQAKLQASVSCSSANYKANQTDLVVTQQWMRTLVWQKSMSLMMLSSAPSDQAMSLSFPTRIVGDLLQFNSILSPEYLKPHGFGMVSYIKQAEDSSVALTR